MPSSAVEPLELLPQLLERGDEAGEARALLFHDCQYSDAEYPHHVGWGHSPLSDTLAFAQRVDPGKLMLFHHDPLHTDDFLDAFHGSAIAGWEELGGNAAQIELASERRELEVSASAEPSAA